MTSYLIAFDVLIFPVIILMVLISSVISAPILPLFTLPLFIISYARPMHFWPNINKSEVETNDTIYYQQLMSQLLQSLRTQSSILVTCRPGSFLLARFDDRLVWIQILECGYNYVKIQVKGLELQETSCHAVEATTIDEMIDRAFYANDESGTKTMFNPYFWYTTQPLDTLIVKTYSDARNVLTGVIDSPDMSGAINSLFGKVLVWVLLKHRIRKSNNNVIHESVVLRPEKQVEMTKNSENGAKSGLLCDVLKNNAQNSSDELMGFDSNNIDLSKWSDDEEESDVLGTDEKVNRQSGSHHSSNSHQTKTSIPSTAEKKAFQTNEDLFETVIESQRQIKSINTEQNIRENFFNTFDSNGNRVIHSSDDGKDLFSEYQVFDDCYQCLSPPEEWTMSSLRYPYRNRTDQGSNQFKFCDDWFKTIIKLMNEKSNELTENQIFSLIYSYKQIVLVCFSCISTLDSMSKTDEMNAQTIYQIFNGKIPDNGFDNNEYLEKNKDFYDIIVKSFQYTVKIALDQILIGEEMSTSNELIQVLIDYDNNWFIGDEKSTDWKESLINEKPNLFSIGKNSIKECFTSHLLSLKQIGVHLCSLNRAVIESIWSSLSLELLYLTNDDEERFSIQANPVILRNLTVQSANAPIGYPVYVSQPILVNHLEY